MEALILILLIPLLGLVLRVLLHLLERSGQSGARSSLRFLLWGCGWIALGAGGWLLFQAVRALVETWQVSPETAPFLFLLRLILPAILFWAGWIALQVGNQTDDPEASMTMLSQQIQDRQRLSVTTLALIVAPLLMLTGWAIILLPMVIAIDYAFQSLVVRGRQNRLLWTLALAARHGRSLPEEIEFLSFTERSRVKDGLRALAAAIRGGTPLSRALLASPQLLDREMAAEIQVAEEQGQVAEVLAEIAARHTRRLRATRWEGSLNGTLVYAAAITFCILSMTSFLLYYIMPKFKAIFDDFGVELPGTTLALIQVSDFFVDYWYLIMPAVLAPLMLLISMLYLSTGRTRWIHSALRIGWPRLSATSILRSLARAMPYEGAPIRVMQSLSAATGDPAESARLGRIGSRLAAGDPLAETLKEERLVTHREAQAITAAQQIGHLPWALSSLADTIELARYRRFGILSELLKPLVILLLALMVFLVGLGMLLPLYKLIGDLS